MNPGDEEALDQILADYLDLVDEAVARISDAEIDARINRVINRVMGADHPKAAKLSLALVRGTRGAADGAVTLAESLATPGRDLRVMRDDDLTETRSRGEELQELLRTCPAGALGTEGSAMVLAAVAEMAENLIEARDERAALRLIRTAAPHRAGLSPGHPAVFDLERAYAEALSQLGWHPQAENRLCRLSEHERRVFGAAHPRTTLYLHWALAHGGGVREAEDGIRALAAELDSPSSAVDRATLLHIQCRRSYLLGRIGRTAESAETYDGVIADRSRELGEDHPDTLDARHSQGRVLVYAGQGAQAASLLRAVVDDSARVLGDDHPNALEARKYFHLARVQAESRDDRVLEQAITALKEILYRQDAGLGTAYPNSKDTLAWLRRLFDQQDRLRSREPISDLRKIVDSEPAMR